MNTKKIIFLVLIILLIGAGGWYGYGKYSDFIWLREMRKEADRFNAEQDRLRVLIAMDTYGGSTPQETLQMFIDAVEKGDYELASKYLVVERLEEWRDNLGNAKNIDEFLKDVKEISKNVDNGRYSTEEDWFLLEKPIYTKFIKYPSGIWKINEI